MSAIHRESEIARLVRGMESLEYQRREISHEIQEAGRNFLWEPAKDLWDTLELFRDLFKEKGRVEKMIAEIHATEDDLRGYRGYAYDHEDA